MAEDSPAFAVAFHWSGAAGTELVIEENGRGLTIRLADAFPPTQVEDVAGSLKLPGQRSSTVEEMDEAVGPMSRDDSK